MGWKANYASKVTYTDSNGTACRSFEYISLALSGTQMSDIHTWAAFRRVDTVAPQPVGRSGEKPGHSARGVRSQSPMYQQPGPLDRASSPIKSSINVTPSIVLADATLLALLLIAQIVPHSTSMHELTTSKIERIMGSPAIEVFSGAYHKAPTPGVSGLSERKAPGLHELSSEGED
ncbi:hypothetical protein K488DRAFT_74656 [Vararia minispora EC-137]|uniref:Uncharacterized protein n=1 Tax=Vararia minispora EC-137 TaxID=1314806 RepID=A0ACB8Q6I8_9AGAM|nr:hypothetical protein K488DRAFT_74656 [Vararia minispora EC-137]